MTQIVPEAEGGGLMSMIDFRYWRCVMKREWKCPDSEINFFLYTPERPFKQWVDVRHKHLLEAYGWNIKRKNVLIIHGFNGTHSKTPTSFLRDAYLSRKDYNVFMVDWSPLTRFPCYLSSLSNMKLAAQCTAQLYSYITQAGALARKITCVGHSLGAHICGMISNHLTEKQYKIIGVRSPQVQLGKNKLCPPPPIPTGVIEVLSLRISCEDYLTNKSQ
ncbi:lipase domain-containing protein [Phthorimaea operculella]|nr:lipase domain-containing protein [Phthorimaea operculella]